MAPRHLNLNLHDLQSIKAMEEASRNAKCGFVQFFFVLSLVLCTLLYASRFFLSPSSRPDLFTPRTPLWPPVPRQQYHGDGSTPLDNELNSPCSSLPNHTICCDRASFHTDVCFMSGDVRTHAASSSLLLFPPQEPPANTTVEERVRPYTRKWERVIMDTVQEVRLRVARPEEAPPCEVRHDAPAVLVTAGGYTGNYYHAFNDGFLPIWVTAQHLRRRTVLAVLAYNGWWAAGYRELIAGLSDSEPIDFVNDKRTHCFPGAIVGTRYHGTLQVDPSRLRDNATILDFRRLLADVYEPPKDRRKQEALAGRRRPRLVIVSRKGTRVIENEVAVSRLAAEVGFDVEVMPTANGIPVAAVYAAVSRCEVMIGVHGADLTNFLFMRPRAALVQIVPLGIERVALECFGEPAKRMGLRYQEYMVRPGESSLSRKYGIDDIVVTDPETAKMNRGWKFVADVYLGGQNVSLDLGRFREVLAVLYRHATVQL